ncbi:hypothetical protein TNCV_3599051 [Trichonephila clavipes]|nr:hypothetical protein TNCV_3599051 [Trichonephila clavipes]
MTFEKAPHATHRRLHCQRLLYKHNRPRKRMLQYGIKISKSKHGLVVKMAACFKTMQSVGMLQKWELEDLFCEDTVWAPMEIR